MVDAQPAGGIITPLMLLAERQGVALQDLHLTGTPLTARPWLPLQEVPDVVGGPKAIGSEISNALLLLPGHRERPTRHRVHRAARRD